MNRSRYQTRTDWGSFQEDSVRTPDYPRKKAKGELPDNPYLWYRIDGKSPLLTTSEGPRTERDVAGWHSFVDSITSGRFHTGHELFVRNVVTQSQIEQITGSKLRQKLNDTPIDLGVALGEYRSTAAMLTGAMETVRGLAQTLRGRRYADAVKYLLSGDDPRLYENNNSLVLAARRSADAWLGFTYGVLPLMKDVEGAVALLTGETGLPEIRVKASHAVQYREVTSCPVGWLLTRNDISGFARCSGRIDIQLSNPFLFDLYKAGILNPLQTAWELIPYSFVVDWFAPIGTWLGSVQPVPGIDSVRGYTSFRAAGVTKRETYNVPHPWYHWRTQGESREVYKQRKLLTSLPQPTFDIGEIALTRDQLISGVSLMVQQVTRENSGSPLALTRRNRQPPQE